MFCLEHVKLYHVVFLPCSTHFTSGHLWVDIPNSDWYIYIYIYWRYWWKNDYELCHKYLYVAYICICIWYPEMLQRQLHNLTCYQLNEAPWYAYVQGNLLTFGPDCVGFKYICQCHLKTMVISSRFLDIICQTIHVCIHARELLLIYFTICTHGSLMQLHSWCIT